MGIQIWGFWSMAIELAMTWKYRPLAMPPSPIIKSFSLMMECLLALITSKLKLAITTRRLSYYWIGFYIREWTQDNKTARLARKSCKSWSSKIFSSDSDINSPSASSSLPHLTISEVVSTPTPTSTSEAQTSLHPRLVYLFPLVLFTGVLRWLPWHPSWSAPFIIKIHCISTLTLNYAKKWQPPGVLRVVGFPEACISSCILSHSLLIVSQMAYAVTNKRPTGKCDLKLLPLKLAWILDWRAYVRQFTTRAWGYHSTNNVSWFQNRER